MLWYISYKAIKKGTTVVKRTTLDPYLSRFTILALMLTSYVILANFFNILYLSFFINKMKIIIMLPTRTVLKV